MLKTTIDSFAPSPGAPLDDARILDTREPARYLVASIAALALDSACLWAGVALASMPAWLAGAFGYVAGLVLIYRLSVTWVFRRRALPQRRREFVVFAALGVVGLCMTSATLAVAAAAGIGLAPAKLLAAGAGFVANFVSRKVLLFSRRPA